MLGVPSNTVDENGIRWRRTRCFMCHMNCGVWCGVDTKTGRLVEMRPNEEEGTVLCSASVARAKKAIKFHYHPSASTTIGCLEKGEDKWEEVSWEQTIDPGFPPSSWHKRRSTGAKTLFSSEGQPPSDRPVGTHALLQSLWQPRQRC